MTHVLCAIDGSRASSDAVAATIELSRKQAAQLHFVGVVRPSPGPQPGISGVMRRRDEVDHQCREAVEAAHTAGLEASLVIRAGDPAKALQREAERMAGEIVMAWPARSLGPQRVRVARLPSAGPRTEGELLRRAA